MRVPESKSPPTERGGFASKNPLFLWCAGTTQFLKKRSENAGANENVFGWVRGSSRNRSESCSENCGFRIDQVVRGHSENGILYSENGISPPHLGARKRMVFLRGPNWGLFLS